MSEINTVVGFLVENGMSEYIHQLLTNGFDTMQTLHDIQENDMDQLGMKLGYRRKLQRALATARGIHPEQPLWIALAAHPSGTNCWGFHNIEKKTYPKDKNYSDQTPKDPTGKSKHNEKWNKAETTEDENISNEGID